jgi:chromosomal replication initiation ATPase DnaA|tara:strand:+ start:366 stop:671 length:306 start_codon:yes stop_codon:yes gene_type:complete
MKEPIFNQIAENVCSIYDISKEKLFTKTKERKVVDARHLLYYGCYDRQIRLTYIQEYLTKNGYKISHSSILHGIDVVSKKMEEDVDYQVIREKIQECVTLS